MTAEASIARGFARCGIAAVLFGASTPAAAVLGDDLGPFVLAGLLYLGAALAMLPAVSGQRVERTAWRVGARPLAAAVVLGGMVGPVLVMMALERAPSSTVSLLLNFEVVFTVALAALVYREHIGGRVFAGMACVALAGMVLGWSGDVELRLGALLAVAACVAWAIDNTTTANLDVFTPQQITLVKGAVAGSANLAIGLAAGGAVDARTAVLALAVGAVGYGASISLWISGARLVGAARGQLIFALGPFVGAALSWVLLDESLAVRSVLAFLVAALGVLLVVRSGHEHEHCHDALDHDHEHVHDDGHHDHEHADGFRGRHAHHHEHASVVHRHVHVPDLHHRHDH